MIHVRGRKRYEIKEIVTINTIMVDIQMRALVDISRYGLIYIMYLHTVFVCGVTDESNVKKCRKREYVYII